MKANTNAIPSYFEKFGDYPPTRLGKFCVDTGQYSEYKTALAERVEANDPVTDWQAFAEPFLAPYKAE